MAGHAFSCDGCAILENSIYYVGFLVQEAVAQICFVKKMFLEILENSQENTCARVFFNKVAGPRPAILLKKRL